MSDYAEKQPDGDVTSAIRSSLSASLNNGTHNGLNSISNDSANLQNQLAATSKLALMSPVDYEEVNSFNNSVQDIKSKYIVLKPQTSSSTATSAAAAATTTTASTFGCNPSATITSGCANTNGKILVNGTSTDKSNNGTGNFDPPNKYDSFLFFSFFLVSWCCCCSVSCSQSIHHTLSHFVPPY